MAGSGPPPDPSSRKSAKNAGRPGGFTLLPASGPGRRPPALPARPRAGERWLAETRAAWKLWWSSPQAVLWQESDVPSLTRLARLHDAYVRDPSDLDVQREKRLLEDRYLFGPLAKLHGRVAVVDDEQLRQPEPEEVRRGGPRGPAGEDPRLRLVRAAGG